MYMWGDVVEFIDFFFSIHTKYCSLCRSNFYEGRDLFQPEGYQGFEPNVELLTDIRNFVAFQNSSAGDGEATTRAIGKLSF